MYQEKQEKTTSFNKLEGLRRGPFLSYCSEVIPIIQTLTCIIVSYYYQVTVASRCSSTKIVFKKLTLATYRTRHRYTLTITVATKAECWPLGWGGAVQKGDQCWGVPCVPASHPGCWASPSLRRPLWCSATCCWWAPGPEQSGAAASAIQCRVSDLLMVMGTLLPVKPRCVKNVVIWAWIAMVTRVKGN